MIHILCTQNWAAGCNPPLRSRKHTERIFVYKLYGFWFGYFINTTLLVGLYKCINDKNGGTLPVLKNEIIDFFFARLGTGSTSLFLTSQRMPSRYGCVHTHIQFFQQKIAGIIRRFFYFWILSYSGFCRKFFISVPFSNINGRVVSWLYSMSYFSMR